MSLKLTSLLVLATATAANGQGYAEVDCTSGNGEVTVYQDSSCASTGIPLTNDAFMCATLQGVDTFSAQASCGQNQVTFFDNGACSGDGTMFSFTTGGCIDLSAGGGGGGGGGGGSGSEGGGDEDDDKVKCDFKRGGVKWECDWFQECYEQEDPADKLLEDSLNGCILKGNKVCARYEKYGQNGKVMANSLANGGCHPSTTCCDGACCGENQECLPMETGLFAYGEFDKDKAGGQEYGGADELNAEHVARMGWTIPNGDAIEARPMHCVTVKFDATTGGKAVFTPFMAMLLLLGSAVAGFRRNKIEGFFDKIAPAFIMLSGFFLMLSEGWEFALFTALVAAATMAAPRDGFKGGCLVLGQLLFCWIYFGGNSYLFVQKGDMKNYFSEAAGNGMTALENSCATFYDFYRFTGQTKPWNVGDTRQTFGLCSKEFIGFQVIMAYVNAFALFTMTTHTLMDYLATVGGASTKATNVANPAAGADNA